jgi:hypothetical protein
MNQPSMNQRPFFEVGALKYNVQVKPTGVAPPWGRHYMLLLLELWGEHLLLMSFSLASRKPGNLAAPILESLVTEFARERGVQNRQHRERQDEIRHSRRCGQDQCCKMIFHNGEIVA